MRVQLKRMIKFIALRCFVRYRTAFIAAPPFATMRCFVRCCAFAAASLILAIVPSVRPPTVLLVVALPFAIEPLARSLSNFLVAPLG